MDIAENDWQVEERRKSNAKLIKLRQDNRRARLSWYKIMQTYTNTTYEVVYALLKGNTWTSYPHKVRRKAVTGNVKDLYNETVRKISGNYQTARKRHPTVAATTINNWLSSQVVFVMVARRWILGRKFGNHYATEVMLLPLLVCLLAG